MNKASPGGRIEKPDIKLQVQERGERLDGHKVLGTYQSVGILGTQSDSVVGDFSSSKGFELQGREEPGGHLQTQHSYTLVTSG